MRASDQGRFVLGCGHGSQEKLDMEYSYVHGVFYRLNKLYMAHGEFDSQ